MENNPAFNQAYYAHLPHEVRALHLISDASARRALAVNLARRFNVDKLIDAEGEDPWKVMKYREIEQLPWTPATGYPPSILSPGPDQVITDFTKIPPYAILTSTDIADYPPIDPAEPPMGPHPLANYVGSDWGAGTWSSLHDDPTLDGQIVEDSRGRFQMHRWIIFGGLEQKMYYKIG